MKNEFWEQAFTQKQEMWGFEPAHSATITKDFFMQHNIKNILIPGIGYGRNAQIFRDNNINVTGIEISQTAIDLARKHYGTAVTIHHGSVSDMPFDTNTYEGIFCYGLIHLLGSDERKKLITDCYNQLTSGGYLVFTAITKDAPTYGQGTPIGKDRFEQFGGVHMFFYDETSIREEFTHAGLCDITTITENFPFWIITCRKP